MANPIGSRKDHDRYYALFNEQPSVSKYTQNTKYQSNLDILEKYLEDAIAKDAWYKEIRYYRGSSYDNKAPNIH